MVTFSYFSENVKKKTNTKQKVIEVYHKAMSLNQFFFENLVWFLENVTNSHGISVSRSQKIQKNIKLEMSIDF